MKKITYLLPFIVAAAIACNEGNGGTTTPNGGSPSIPSIPFIQFNIQNVLRHDTSFFTEGLEFYKGQLFESSGGNLVESPFPSAVAVVNTATGKNDIKIELDKSLHFGEGITFFNDKLYILTWKSGIGFVYDATSFKKIKEFPLPSKEGWGLTHDSTNLIMSDGSSNLYYLSPDSLKLQKIVGVKDQNGPVPNINELEYINGYIYANQWLSNLIMKIDPRSGQVTGKLLLSNLTKEARAKYSEAESLNGIAYNPASGTIYVTGKKWPNIYEIKISDL